MSFSEVSLITHYLLWQNSRTKNNEGLQYCFTFPPTVDLKEQRGHLSSLPEIVYLKVVLAVATQLDQRFLSNSVPVQLTSAVTARLVVSCEPDPAPAPCFLWRCTVDPNKKFETARFPPLPDGVVLHRPRNSRPLPVITRRPLPTHEFAL